MDTLVIPILAAVSLAAIIYALWPSGAKEEDRLKRRMTGKKSTDETAEIREKVRQSVASKMVQRVAPLAVKPVMPKDSTEMSKLKLKLCSAGFRSDHVSSVFLASKTILAIIVLIACSIYCWMAGKPLLDAIGISAFGAGIGFLLPNMWLNSVSARRREQVKDGLADSLDLMVVAVEAGLGLDAAIQRVSDELRTVHPALSEELQIAVLETQMGIPRSESLSNMANRTNVDELRALVAIINQAERFGTSIAKALRNQAGALRMKRRQAAEERAQQCAVKLMMPLILFIFPSIFIVLVGPAVINLMNSGFGQK